MIPPHRNNWVAGHPNRKKKRQKVDAGIILQLDDPKIARDAKILSFLRDTVRSKIGSPQRRRLPVERPTLYRWYRGAGFPLRKLGGNRLPTWRNLSPWMKAQLATLVLSELGWMAFKIHVHDDLWHQWVQDDRPLRNELRNRIAAHLKRRFGDKAPGFFFVMENATTSGEETRPHVHGSVGLVRASLPVKGKGSRSLQKMAKLEGLEKAELEAGNIKIREALWAAAGGKSPRIAAVSGIDQSRNVWLHKPYHPIFNYQHVDYAFRNSKRVSNTLGESRFAMTNPLRAEARRLWNLLKKGDAALDQWDET